MRSVVIVDTSCLILVKKIGHINLLHQVYQEIVTTPEVKKEFLEPLPNWIRIEAVKDEKYQAFLETQLDWGEASALALAKELDNPLPPLLVFLTNNHTNIKYPIFCCW